MAETRHLTPLPGPETVVRDLMRPGVICPHDLCLREVIRMMLRHAARSVAVQGSSGRIIGLLAEWDLLRYYGSHALDELTAGEALHEPPHFVGPDETAREALKRMHRAGVPHLIVAEGPSARDEPLGMVSTHDLIVDMAAMAGGAARRSG